MVRRRTPEYRQLEIQRAREWKLKNPAKTLFRIAKYRAQKRGIPFTITLDDVVIPKLCPVLGVELSFDTSWGPNVPTLDRIDNDRGYIPGNVVVISFKANRIKTNATQQEVEAVAHWMKGWSHP